jgi:hypothetical protein
MKKVFPKGDIVCTMIGLLYWYYVFLVYAGSPATLMGYSPSITSPSFVLNQINAGVISSNNIPKRLPKTGFLIGYFRLSDYQCY